VPLPDFSTNLRLIRTARGYSQRVLGVRAGFTPFYISQLERGLTPSADVHVDRLAAALGVPRATLTDGNLRERLLPMVTAR
jgi:transcriptional regulator with XRE-family HTH domain